MKLKLFKKFFFTTALIIVFSLTIMMMILVFVFNSYLSKSKYETLNQCCESVTSFIKDSGFNKNDSGSLYNVMNTITNVSDVDIFVVDNKGDILICGCDDWSSNSTCDHSGDKISDSVLKRADKNNISEISTLDIYTNPHYVVAYKFNVSDNNGNIYVFATSPMSSIKSLMMTVFKLYVFYAAIPLIIIFFAIYAMIYKLTKPLKLMSEASKAMAKGDFSKRIPVTTDDEIGELATSFNKMTNSLVQLEGMRKSFVANVSHELKTPMTTIGGFIDGIIDGTIEPDKQMYYLKIVSSEVQRLSRLVQSMLSMSKLESGEFVLKPELFDFRELLCTIVISQEQRIDKHGFDIVGLDTMPSVSITADKDLIHQVIYNLVDNAVKFTEDNGKINFNLFTENKHMIFEITNTGKGIPEKELPLVFERFYKVDKSRSANKISTGLGLYIAKTIIKSHNGSISVLSKENQFTTFKIILPLE